MAYQLKEIHISLHLLIHYLEVIFMSQYSLPKGNLIFNHLTNICGILESDNDAYIVNPDMCLTIVLMNND